MADVSRAAGGGRAPGRLLAAALACAVVPAVAACGAGRPALESSLLVASAPAPASAAGDEPTDAPTAAVEVEHDHLVLDGVLPAGAGCGPVRGAWTLAGERVDVRLSPTEAAACPAPARATAWRARVGPLVPGEYRVRVTLGERALVAGRAVRIR